MPIQYIQSGTSVGEGFSIASNNTNFIPTGASFSNQTITFTAKNGTVFTCPIPVNSNGLSAIDGSINQSTTPNQYNKFTVSPVDYFYSGSEFSISATTISLLPNVSATNRYDAVIIQTSTNTIDVIEGTPGAPPTFPTLSSDQLIVGAIEVRGNSSTNDATDFVLKYSIFEKEFARLFVEKNPNDQLLDDLQDVVITIPASGHLLRYNGTNWINSSASYVDRDANNNSYVEAFSTAINGNTNIIGSVSSSTINSYGSILHSSEALTVNGYKNFALDTNDSYINGNNNIVLGANSLTINGFNNVLYAPHNGSVVDQSDTAYLKNIRMNGGFQISNVSTVNAPVTISNDQVLTIVDNSISGVTVQLSPTHEGHVWFVKAKYANDNPVVVQHALQTFILNASGVTENKGRGSIFVYDSISNLVNEFGKDSPIGNVNVTGATFSGPIFTPVLSANTIYVSGTSLDSVIASASTSFTNGITNISGNTYGLGGSLTQTTNLNINGKSFRVVNGANTITDFTNFTEYDSNQILSIDKSGRNIYSDHGGAKKSIDYQNRTLHTSAGTLDISANYHTRNLVGNWSAGTISATTIYSGSTELSSIFASSSPSFTNGITNISGNTYGLGGNIVQNTQINFATDDALSFVIGDGGGNRASIIEMFARADVWLESLGSGGGLGRIILDGNGVSLNTNESLGGFGVYGASLFTTNLTDRRIFEFPNQSGTIATKNDLNFTLDSATNVIDINGKGLTINDGANVKWHVYDNILYDNSNIEAHDLVNRTLKNSAGAVTINYSTAANGLALSNIGSSNFVRLKNTNVTTTRTLEFPNASGRISLSGESLPLSGTDLSVDATSSLNFNVNGGGGNENMLYVDTTVAALYHLGSGGSQNSNIEVGDNRAYINWEDTSDYAIIATSASGVSLSTQAGAAFYSNLRNDNLTSDRNYQFKDESGNIPVSQTIDIGSWDFTSTGSTFITHGLGSSWDKIKSISVVLRTADNTRYCQLMHNFKAPSSYGLASGSIGELNSSTIALHVDGSFNPNPFSGSTNRGYITFTF